jgi:hypothetical protein
VGSRACFSPLARAFGSLSFALLGLLRVSFIRPSVALVYRSGRACVLFPPDSAFPLALLQLGKAASGGTADPHKHHTPYHLCFHVTPIGRVFSERNSIPPLFSSYQSVHRSPRRALGTLPTTVPHDRC